MTDALNPSLPVAGSQVQIASELRGIKARLVTDKANIEQLQVQITPLLNAGSNGLQLLASTNAANSRTILGGTLLGQQLFTVADNAALDALIGLTDFSESIYTNGNNHSITLSGGLRINTIRGTFTDGASHTWPQYFASSVFAVVVGGNQDENGSYQAYNISNIGCNVSFDGGGSKTYSIIAIGV